MNRNKLILAAIIFAVVVVAGLYFSGVLTKSGSGLFNSQEVSVGEPLDIVSDFYQPWLNALQSTTTDPLTEGLANNPLLSTALRDRLNEAMPEGGYAEGMIDQVICQTVVPENISMKQLYLYPDEKAQVLVFTKGGDQAGQAIVTLLAQNGGWYIDDILCSRGEFDVPREFTFDTDGFLLKQVPPPYESGKWHVVFEQNGQAGYVAPLIFSATSMCTPNGAEAEAACTPDQYEEAKKVHIQGQMTEVGVDVQHLKFIE